jgi:glycopeptide antibiotics resistance protein
MISIGVYLLASLLIVVYSDNNHQRIVLFKILISLLLGYYSIFLMAVLFLDGYFFSRADTYYVNKIPLFTIKNFYRYMRDNNDLNAFANLVGNAMLFAPMGLLLPLFSRKFDNIVIFSGFITMLVASVEYFQHYLHVGGADVDDIILNVLGAFVVYMIYKLFRYLLKDKIEVYFKD